MQSVTGTTVWLYLTSPLLEGIKRFLDELGCTVKLYGNGKLTEFLANISTNEDIIIAEASFFCSLKARNWAVSRPPKQRLIIIGSNGFANSANDASKYAKELGGTALFTPFNKKIIAESLTAKVPKFRTEIKPLEIKKEETERKPIMRQTRTIFVFGEQGDLLAPLRTILEKFGYHVSNPTQWETLAHSVSKKPEVLIFIEAGQLNDKEMRAWAKKEENHPERIVLVGENKPKGLNTEKAAQVHKGNIGCQYILISPINERKVQIILVSLGYFPAVIDDEDEAVPLTPPSPPLPKPDVKEETPLSSIPPKNIKEEEKKSESVPQKEEKAEAQNEDKPTETEKSSPVKTVVVEETPEEKRERPVLSQSKQTVETPFQFDVLPQTGGECALAFFTNVRTSARDMRPVLLAGGGDISQRLLATIMHLLSSRIGDSLLLFDCEQCDAKCISSVLFGKRGTTSIIQLVESGMLVLMNIEAMPLETQKAILYTMETGFFTATDGSSYHKTNARILVATQQDPGELLKQERLLSQFAEAKVETPKLSEMPEFVPVISRVFLQQFSNGSESPGITQEVLDILCRYQWSGASELQAVLYCAFNQCNGNPIALKHLPTRLQDFWQEQKPQSPETPKETVVKTKEDGQAKFHRQQPVEQAEVIEDAEVEEFLRQCGYDPDGWPPSALEDTVREIRRRCILKAIKATSGVIGNEVKRLLCLEGGTKEEQDKRYQWLINNSNTLRHTWQQSEVPENRIVFPLLHPLPAFLFGIKIFYLKKALSEEGDINKKAALLKVNLKALSRIAQECRMSL